MYNSISKYCHLNVLHILDNENDVYLYADDMLIMSADRDEQTMINNLQEKMDKIYKWCRLNKLTINEAKTKYMVVTSRKVIINTPIRISTHSLGRVKHYEYLGMIIDERLNMDKQVAGMYKKANKKLGILARIRIFITCETACKIYKTMIRPHLEYVDFIIESGSKIYVNKLDRLQERALR